VTESGGIITILAKSIAEISVLLPLDLQIKGGRVWVDNLRVTNPSDQHPAAVEDLAAAWHGLEVKKTPHPLFNRPILMAGKMEIPPGSVEWTASRHQGPGGHPRPAARIANHIRLLRL
jgi:hypothetical protein